MCFAVLAKKTYKSAKGQPIHRVLRAAPDTKGKRARRIADPEFIDAYSEYLCRNEMTELVRHDEHHEYCNDEKFATININEVEAPNEGYIGRCLYVAWYKNEGGTDGLWILDGAETPRQPTETELLAIIRAYTRANG
mgnify:CR=1 FL=1